MVAERAEPAARHGLPRRLALRGGDRGGRPRALRPGDGHGLGRARARRHRTARRRQPLDAHGALRAGRLDVRLGRLELQRLRREGPAARGDRALPARRGGEEVFATGLRNSVGFDWRPADGQLYATDNGRDLLGDDFPPCELNRIVEGGFYGWPIANGDRVPDPDFGKGQEARIAASIPPVHGFRAHNAPLGMTFLRSEGCPPSTAARRSSRSTAPGTGRARTATRSSRCTGAADGQIEERDFLTGFLGASDDDVIGRPVDVAEGPDGAVYVSDDYAGSIYRVGWGGTGRRRGAPAGAAAAPPGRSPATSPRAEVARGRALYARYACAACHDRRRAPAGHGHEAARGPLEALRRAPPSPRTCARRTRRCPPST